MNTTVTNMTASSLVALPCHQYGTIERPIDSAFSWLNQGVAKRGTGRFV